MTNHNENFNLETTLDEMKSIGTELLRKHYMKNGATGEYYGTKKGDIRKIAKKIKNNPLFARKLWKTEILEARLLATLLLKPIDIELDEMEEFVKSIKNIQVADWFNAYIVKKHPKKEILREKWMKSNNPMLLRAGWNLTSIKVVKEPESLEMSSILERIENEMKKASPIEQWTMNTTLVEIGINIPKYRKRALDIGESLGVYSDYKAPKGCTTPFAPIWIKEMVERNKKK
ncbi:DNA alkylation repair protein [Promethearchaeum syntrophicum]|uniref:DNA alkylation repair protein n=1 Tax=Promethearchaeum syntrophicum TaxID=2594042 RepID=A0A5B9DDS0_9ARCH|nr:DNA alkylation repair protein [Candidatus Prometheoarchaeum syntrophicum]QEE17155.1 DNA alkylation repair enzyme [Candidatus Prometheoarchaeum syntrophicum]